ncbi:MAG: hypothetical protein ACR2JQ_07115 [Mycobacteriales bacterium]
MAALLVCGCTSGGGSASAASTAASSPPAPRTSEGPAVGPTGSALDHLAPDLEALLPKAVDGTSLSRVSTTGAAIFAKFGGTDWSRQMTRFLRGTGKTPADLRYAQAFDASKKLALDAGAFEVHGVSAGSLATAIVNSSKPDSPGLTTASETVGGAKVTAETDPASGSTLYLYPHDGVVFYVGGDQRLAAAFLTAVR